MDFRENTHLFMENLIKTFTVHSPEIKINNSKLKKNVRILFFSHMHEHNLAI